MWFHLWSIAISDDASQRPYQLRRISSAKHRAHDGIVIWSLCAICFRNWKECHRTAIISVSRSSITPALTYTKSCFVVQKMGVSASNSRSLQKWDFGAGRCTGCPSSINSKSCHWMIWWFHLKSFKKITSAFSAPTQAKVDEAGLLNDLKTTFKGFRRNVLPVFAGPVIKMFLCFPLPFSKRFITALVKTSMEMSFHVSSCLAHCSHRPKSPLWTAYSSLILHLRSPFPTQLLWPPPLLSCLCWRWTRPDPFFPLLFGRLRVRVTRFEFLFASRLLWWTLRKSSGAGIAFVWLIFLPTVY